MANNVVVVVLVFMLNSLRNLNPLFVSFSVCLMFEALNLQHSAFMVRERLTLTKHDLTHTSAGKINSWTYAVLP